MLSLVTRSVARTASASSTFSIPRTVIGARSVTNLAKKAYTAHAQSSGKGRDGIAKLISEGEEPLELKLAMPKALGGKGDGQNPEQLFALGYSACFLSAMNHVAGSEKIKLPANTTVQAHVSIGTPAEGSKPFAIAVDLVVTSDAKGGEEKKRLQEVVEKAHEVCPYSNATRNNVPVNLTVQ